MVGNSRQVGDGAALKHVDREISWDDDGYTLPPRGRVGAGQVFAVLYVVATVAAGAMWIWASTVPGLRFESGMVSALALMAIGAIWIVCAAVTVWRIATKRARRPGWYLFAVAGIGLGLIVVTVLALPVRARFEFVRSDFDQYAHEVLQAAEGVDPSAVATSPDPGYGLLHPEVPDAVGGFSLSRAEIVPEGLLIFDAEGGPGFNDAGFAYLPDGEYPPGTGSFESPQFRSLGGGWYTFNASW